MRIAVTMLGAISKYISDVSVLRRLLFAVVHLPQDLPNYWGVAVEFATKGKESRNAISSQQAQMFMENIQTLDDAAFCSESQLQINLVEFQVHVAMKLVNVSEQTYKCM